MSNWDVMVNISQDSNINTSDLDAPDLLTSGDLLHEDLEVSVLAEGAKVLNDVPVAQATVEFDLLMEGLHFSERKLQSSHRAVTATDTSLIVTEQNTVFLHNNKNTKNCLKTNVTM